METGKIRIKTNHLKKPLPVYEPLQTFRLSAKLIAIIGRFSVILFIIEIQNSDFNICIPYFNLYFLSS